MNLLIECEKDFKECGLEAQEAEVIIVFRDNGFRIHKARYCTHVDKNKEHDYSELAVEIAKLGKLIKDNKLGKTKTAPYVHKSEQFKEFVKYVGEWAVVTHKHSDNLQTLKSLSCHALRELREFECATERDDIKEEISDMYILSLVVVHIWECDIRHCEIDNGLFLQHDYAVLDLKQRLTTLIKYPGAVHGIIQDLESMAHYYDFDLIEEAKKKMKINEKRKWKAPDEDGVIEHVKEG